MSGSTNSPPSALQAGAALGRHAASRAVTLLEEAARHPVGSPARAALAAEAGAWAQLRAAEAVLMLAVRAHALEQGLENVAVALDHHHDPAA
ncbi:hypothetical protein BIV57_00635 [Mangrovactinospora gilvigrisea]|uniref:Uncharacterized protein n=1 Tax=Mangrovactinospora gilvigrisea TaxID=1428644 RepID=A0A1J7CCV7_9ACTN|nr:hypothetical protein [Mangrovactinospora gilvigrisea]OIV39384.1 hypothetical protein BIV57_00635 [Mangrovactinospora gilvigrisea]